MERGGRITLLNLTLANASKLVPTLLLVAVVAVSGAYPMRLIQRIVNLAVSKGAGAHAGSIVVLGSLYWAVFLLESVARYAMNVSYRSLQANQGHDLRLRLWAHVLRMRPLPQTGVTTSDIVMDALKDSEITTAKFLGPVVYIVQAATEFAVGIAIMASINWQMTLLVVPLGFISATLVGRTGGTMRSLAATVRDRTTEMWSWFAEGMRGVQDAQTNNGVEDLCATLEDRSRALTRASIREAQYDEKVGGFNRAFFMAVIGVVMTFGALLVSRGRLSIGGLTAFMMYNGMLVDPIANYLRQYADLQATRVSIDRLNRLLTLPAFDSGTLAVPHGAADIHISEMRFGYGDGRPVFRGLNWHVRAGERIAIVGPSGSGKTTLAQLIVGLHRPDGGDIRVGGATAPGAGGDGLRANVGVVLQHPYLFNMSLEDNIKLGCRDAGEERVRRAVKMAGLERYRAAAPDGLRTIVGEGGGRLSGGERQRVAIARALVRDPDILILDEGTSALDSTTAKEILDEMVAGLEGVTLLVVAHKISSIVAFPRIVVLNGGEIVGDGRHEALLEGCPVYAGLYAHQFAAGEA